MPLPIYKHEALEERPHISFSEAHTFSLCPYKHWQQYREKITSEQTIYTTYGSAVGEALERFRKDGVSNSWISLCKKIFRFVLENGFGEYVSERDQDWRIWAKSALRIFKDTLAFLDEKYPGWELIDFEFPLYEDIDGANKKFKGFIDLIFKWQDKIYILDFKTCGWGWTPEQKSDTHKLYQVILYKYFYCQKTGTDPKNVETAYLLLKRKPAKKETSSVELFEISSGKVKINNSIIWLKEQAEGIERGLKLKNKSKCKFCICE